jgi:hypothetical protein
MTNEGIWECLEIENVAEVRQYQRNWKKHIARMTTGCLQGKHTVTVLWEHINCVDKKVMERTVQVSSE